MVGINGDGNDGEESTEPSSKGGLSDKSSRAQSEKIPDPFVFLATRREEVPSITLFFLWVSEGNVRNDDLLFGVWDLSFCE